MDIHSYTKSRYRRQWPVYVYEGQVKIAEVTLTVWRRCFFSRTCPLQFSFLAFMHLFRNNGAKGETRHLSKRACLDHGKLYIHSGKIAACDEKKLLKCCNTHSRHWTSFVVVFHNFLRFTVGSCVVCDGLFSSGINAKPLKTLKSLDISENNISFFLRCKMHTCWDERSAFLTAEKLRTLDRPRILLLLYFTRHANERIC